MGDFDWIKPGVRALAYGKPCSIVEVSGLVQLMGAPIASERWDGYDVEVLHDDRTIGINGTMIVMRRDLAPVPAHLDALGRPVPEWARAAFDLLAKDGRRVQVGVGLPSGGRRRGDAVLLTWQADKPPSVSVWQVDAETHLDGWHTVYVGAAGRTLADVARRALAMEAERNAPKSPTGTLDLATGGTCARGVAIYPGQTTLTINAAPPRLTEEQAASIAASVQDGIKKRAVIEAIADVARSISDMAHRLGTPRHNATCPRCHGPAYQGLGLPTCERAGGCLADAVPGRDDVREGAGLAGERYYSHALHTSAIYATRDLAIAAWREALLARAKREAGQ